MPPITPKTKQEIYLFRGKEILSDAWTVARLNYALAMNMQPDRYILKQQVDETPIEP
jgi:hypothetical protein